MKRPLSLAPGKAAALFIDLQEEHRRDRRYLVAGFDRVIANVRDLQTAARAHHIPVVHAVYVVDPSVGPLRPFHPMMADGTSAFSDKDSPLTAICPEVGPIGHEDVLVKSEASAFAGENCRPGSRPSAANGFSSPASGPKPASTRRSRMRSSWASASSSSRMPAAAAASRCTRSEF